MTDHPRTPHRSDDDALQRLRAADPAAQLEPDLESLDAAVRARTAEPADELATVRARRGRRSWFLVAAAAAGVLVIGGGGYALGAGLTRGAELATGGAADHVAGAAITLSQPAAGRAEAGSAPVPATGTAADSAAKSPDLFASGWYGGRTQFSAVGLSGAAGSAEAWAYDPAAVFSAETAKRIAAALGLAGEPALVDGAWTIGGNDGSAPTLQVQPDGVASLNYYDPRLDAYSCEKLAQEGSASSGGSAGSAGSDSASSVEPGVALPTPSCASTSNAPAPQGPAAVAKAKDVLRSIGLDAGDFEYETQDSGTPQYAYVTAFEVVAGERTGAVWSVSLVGTGIQSLNGALAPVVSLGTYAVVSPTTAVERLTDPRFGVSYGGPYAMDMRKAAGSPASAAAGSGTTTDLATAGPAIATAPARTLPPTAKAGATFAWPVGAVTLTTARLGLTVYSQPDGSTVLLPAYALSSADGQVWSVVAVADAQLNFAPVG